MKPALRSIPLGISTAIYDDEGSREYIPKKAHWKATAFHLKMPVCSMMNGFARQKKVNETSEGSATP